MHPDDDEPTDDLTPEQDALAADRPRRERMPGDERQADVEAARYYERWLDTWP